MDTMNDSGIRKNLSLLRPIRGYRSGELPMHDYPVLPDQRQWDGLCCTRGTNKGSYVEGAPFASYRVGQRMGPAMSRVTILNTSPHVPTVLATTHRRISHHLHTEAERYCVSPRKGVADATLSPRTKVM